MAAVAEVVSDEAKYRVYEQNVAKLPKRDRRDLAAAGPQTKWIIEAVRQWYEFGYRAGSVAGLPTESAIMRIGVPRAPIKAGMPIADPPPLVLAVNKAMEELRDSRIRVLLACERFSAYGIERAARHLDMSVASTKKYLKEARDALAHVLRGMGWKVPKEG